MKYSDIILTGATLFGPVISALIAIYYTRFADARRVRTDRRFEVFRNLMKTRGFQLHPDHVMALNLIQSDFADDETVLACLKTYVNHLYRNFPNNSPENERFLDERELLFGKLLVAIAKSLGIELEADDVRHFRYSPSGWASAELEQQQVRKLLISFLQGMTPIAIKSAAQQQQPAAQLLAPLFPPPPLP